MWSIDPNLRERIEQTLGERWPSDPAALASVLTRLQVEYPELYRETIEAISGSSVPLTVDVQHRRRERRNQLWALLWGWFGKQSQTGELLPRRSRILAAGVVGLIGIFITLMGIAAMGRRHQGPVRRNAPPAYRESPVGKPEIPEAPPKSTVPSLLPGLPLPSYPQGDAQPPSILPEDLGPAHSSSRQRLPQRFSHQVVIFEAKIPREATSLLIFEAPKISSGAGDTQASSHEQAPADLSVHEEAESEKESRPVSPFIVGHRLDAQLATGVALTPGIAHPVVAETTEPHVQWIGEATVDRAGLVQIAFSSAVQEGREYSGFAIALDPRGQHPGISGRSSTHSAAAVSRIVGASMKAVGDYTQALLRAKRVTMVNGWASIRADEPPPFWSLVAARLAEVLNDLEESRRSVRVTEVPAGTPVTILVLQGGSRP